MGGLQVSSSQELAGATVQYILDAILNVSRYGDGYERLTARYCWVCIR